MTDARCRYCRGVPFADPRQGIEEHNLACARTGERSYPVPAAKPTKQED